MELTFNLIKSVANLFSIEELQTQLQKATLAMLENPDSIISASTGSGASYSKSINMKPAELVELLSACLEFKQSGTISTSGNNIMPTISLII